MSTHPIKNQPAPTPNDRPAVWPLVIADMQERDAIGRERYGTPLQPFNGRDALVDAYQEALDLCVYLRQAIAERDGLREDRDAWKESEAACERENRALAEQNANLRQLINEGGACCQCEVDKYGALMEWCEIHTERDALATRLAAAEEALVAAVGLLRTPDNGANVCRWCGNGPRGSHESSCWYADYIAQLDCARALARAYFASSSAAESTEAGSKSEAIGLPPSDAEHGQVSPASVEPTPEAQAERIYPCAHPGCTTMRTRAEGGTVFTVCDEHWDAAHREPEAQAKCAWLVLSIDSADHKTKDCDKPATHTCCDYGGNVCEEHRCRCSKPLDTGPAAGAK